MSATSYTENAIRMALDAAAAEVGKFVESRWKEQAASVLGGSKRQWMLSSYLESIHTWPIESGTGQVTVGFPKQVGEPTPQEKVALLAELGADETDMRDYMLEANSPGVKINKQGKKYRFVPITRSEKRTDAYLADAATGQPEKTVRRLRSILDEAAKQPLGSVDANGKVRIDFSSSTEDNPVGAHFKKGLQEMYGKKGGATAYSRLGRKRPHHVDILVERSYYLQAGYAKNAVTGAVNTQLSGVRTFRTISEDNGGWIRPAMAPVNVWDLVAADLNTDVAAIAQQAFADALAGALS